MPLNLCDLINLTETTHSSLTVRQLLKSLYYKLFHLAYYTFLFIYIFDLSVLWASLFVLILKSFLNNPEYN